MKEACISTYKAALGTVKSPTIVDEKKEYTYFVSHLFWFPGTNLKTCIGKVKSYPAD